MPKPVLPHYWTREQVQQLLDAMPTGKPWLLTYLLWRTALRVSEALNLEWRDLRFDGANPSVIVRSGKGGRFRVVPAHDELIRAFQSVKTGRPQRPDFQRPRRCAAVTQDGQPLGCPGHHTGRLAACGHRNRRQGTGQSQSAAQRRPSLATVRH